MAQNTSMWHTLIRARTSSWRETRSRALGNGFSIVRVEQQCAWWDMARRWQTEQLKAVVGLLAESAKPQQAYISQGGERYRNHHAALENRGEKVQLVEDSNASSEQ
jgi:hypothetical protein